MGGQIVLMTKVAEPRLKKFCDMLEVSSAHGGVLEMIIEG